MKCLNGHTLCVWSDGEEPRLGEDMGPMWMRATWLQKRPELNAMILCSECGAPPDVDASVAALRAQLDEPQAA